MFADFPDGFSNGEQLVVYLIVLSIVGAGIYGLGWAKSYFFKKPAPPDDK